MNALANLSSPSALKRVTNTSDEDAFASFHFPDSGLYLSNGFDFYFDPL